MIQTSNEILKLVNDFLDQLPYERKPQSLYDPIRYVLSIGGKRIRPVLMLMAYNLYKDNPESILMPACGLETYHNYTLLHDDLMALWLFCWNTPAVIYPCGSPPNKPLYCLSAKNISTMPDRQPKH